MPNQPLRQTPRTHLATAEIETEEIAALAVTTAKLASQAVTTVKLSAAAVGTDKAKTNLKAHVIPIEGSFESGEQITRPLYASVSWLVTAWKIVVTKQLAATDAGTITLKDGSGATVDSQSIPAGTVVETLYDRPVSFTLAAGQALKLVTAKTTPGGKVLVLVYVILNGDG